MKCPYGPTTVIVQQPGEINLGALDDIARSLNERPECIGDECGSWPRCRAEQPAPAPDAEGECPHYGDDMTCALVVKRFCCYNPNIEDRATCGYRALAQGKAEAEQHEEQALAWHSISMSKVREWKQRLEHTEAELAALKAAPVVRVPRTSGCADRYRC